MFKRMAAGSRGALEQILETYGSRLHHSIMRLVHNEPWADEILLDTLMALWENRHWVAKLENPAGWLFTTARYKAIDKIRQEKNHTAALSLEDINPEEDAASAEEQLYLKELNEAIRRAVEQLPPQEKEVYSLFTQGCNRRQIAEKCGLAESTVKNHLTLARKAIRRFVANAMRLLV